MNKTILIYRNGKRKTLENQAVSTAWIYLEGKAFNHQITTREGSFFFECDIEAEKRADEDLKARIKAMDPGELTEALINHGLKQPGRHGTFHAVKNNRANCEKHLFNKVKNSQL